MSIEAVAWHTTRMRETGSNTVVVEDVFGPEGHPLMQAGAREGTGARFSADPEPGPPWMPSRASGIIHGTGRVESLCDFTSTSLDAGRDVHFDVGPSA